MYKTALDIIAPLDRSEYLDELDLIEEAEEKASKDLQKEREKDLFLLINQERKS